VTDYLEELRNLAERGEYCALGFEVLFSPLYLPFYLLGRLAGWLLGVDRGESE